MIIGEIVAQQINLVNNDHFEYQRKLDHFNYDYAQTIPATFKAISTSMPGVKYESVILLLTTNTGSQKYQVPNWVNLLPDRINSLVLVVPTRFYGNDEQPDSFFEDTNLKYLTVAQIIEDIVELVQLLKVESFGSILPQTPFFVMGDRNMGSICIWVAEKHPTIIQGCIAQDPILEAIPDYQDPDFLAYSKINQEDSICLEKVLQMINNLENMLASSSQQQEFMFQDLKRVLNTYTNLELLDALGEQFIALAQSDQIQSYCNFVYGEESVQVQIQKIFTLDLERGYYQFFSQNQLKQSEYLKRKERLWLWQQCNEFGLFNTHNPTAGIKSVFLTLEYYFKTKCQNLFHNVPDNQLFNYEYINEIYKISNFSNLSKENVLIVWRTSSYIRKSMMNRAVFQYLQVDCDECNSSQFMVQSQQSEEQTSLEQTIKLTIVKWIFKYQSK